MKIAIFTDTFLPNTNGVVTSLCNQIKGLVKKGYKVIMFAPAKKEYTDYYEGAKIYYLKSTVSPYPDFRLSWPTQYGNKINDILLEEKPDLYHIQTPLPLGIAGNFYGRKFGRPVVSTFHTYVEGYAGHLTKGRFEDFMKKTVGRSSWIILRMLYKYSDRIIVPGKNMAIYLNEHGIKHTVVVPTGIEPRKMPAKKIDIREKYGIPKNAEIILYFGRISFEKKIDVLLKAFEIVKKNNKNAFLVIAGSGPDLNKLKKKAAAMNLQDIVFTGYVPDEDVPFLFNESAIFASASDTETQGMTFSEALFAGKPLVGADRFGAKDMIINSKNGFLFRIGKPFSMAERIITILNDKKLAKKMGQCSKKMSEQYTVEKFANNLIKVYRELTNT